MTDYEEFKKDVETQLRDFEERMKQGAGVGVQYSRLQRQLGQLALQMEALIQSLRKLLPEFDKNFEEFCTKLKKKHETDDEADFHQW